MGIVRKIYNSKIILLYFKLVNLLSLYGLPLMLLAIRIRMAQIFGYSGLTKIEDIKTAIYLFKYEYKTPLISPELAAYFVSFMEVTASILLILGLFTRLAAIPLLILTGVIEYTYISLEEHVYWAYLLSIIILYGPDKISLDNMLLFKANV